MIIQGVFSMSILNRLKSLIFGEGDKKEKTDSKVQTKEKVDVTSSKKTDNVVSLNKTSEKISNPESGSKDMPSEKDLHKKENAKETKVTEASKTAKVEEPPKEEVSEVEELEVEETSEENPESNEDIQEEETDGSNLIDGVETSGEEVETEVKKEDGNTNENNKKRDNMTLLTDKELITSESLDKDFTAAFIDAGIETVKNCFQCGTCGGSCPSGRRTPYKVRQLVRKCLLGLKEQVISDDALWMCTTCYTCQERCPRSVIIVGIVKKARNIAAHAGYMAKAHKMTGLFVITTGHGVPINPVTKELRERVGLGPLPPTTHMFPEALEEVQKICKITGFDDLIGYDEATGELKD